MTKGEEIVAKIIEKLSVITSVDAVYDWREVNLDKLQVPAIIVKDLGERPTLSPTRLTYVTMAQVSVEIIVQGRDKHEPLGGETPAVSEIRALTEEVEAILVKDWQTLDGVINYLIYTGAIQSASAVGEVTTMSRILTFDGEYFRNLTR